MTAPGTDSRPAVGITRLKIAGLCPTAAHRRGVGRLGLSVPGAAVECCAEELLAPPGGTAPPFHRRGPPVTYVRPHYRRDGTYVKGHNRRTRPRTAPPRTAPRRTPRVSTGPTTYVRPYHRTDGTRVRGHHRLISPRTIAVTAGTRGGEVCCCSCYCWPWPADREPAARHRPARRRRTRHRSRPLITGRTCPCVVSADQPVHSPHHGAGPDIR